MTASHNELADLALRCSFMLAPTRSEDRSRIRNVERNEPLVSFWQGSRSFYQWTFSCMGWEAHLTSFAPEVISLSFNPLPQALAI